MTVSYVLHHAGLPIGPGPKGFAWASAGADHFRAQGRNHPSTDARPGDIAYMEWGTTAGGYDHVGMIVENTGRDLLLLEGNVSDSVAFRRRRYSEVPEVSRPPYADTPPPPQRRPTPMIALVTDTDGRLVEFRTFPNGKILHRWQTTPGGGWSEYAWGPPAETPGAFASVAAAVNRDGRLEVLAWHSAFGVAFRSWQSSNGGPWSAWVRAD
jgi:hypothetical protein